MKVVALPARRAGEVVEVLCDAFGAYPVMQYVIPPGPEYHTHLRALVEYFVMARFLRGGLVLGATAGGRNLVGVATVTLPGERSPPESLGMIRASVWRRLGRDARQRSEAFGEACGAFDIEDPHYHLNMIGVRAASAGQGVGRVLLEAVHHASASDRGSCGVSLTTEDSANLPLYRRFGYRLTGQVRVAEDLESWGFFRPDD